MTNRRILTLVTAFALSVTSAFGQETPPVDPANGKGQSQEDINRALERRIAALESELREKDEPEVDDNTFRVYWRRGLRGETTDGNFRFRFHVRIHNDFVQVLHDDVDRNPLLGFDEKNRVLFRRAFFGISGRVYELVDFKMQYDFAEGDGAFKGVWAELRKVPIVGRVRVGQTKEPLSLQTVTSSDDHTFIERATLRALTPNRNTGIVIGDSCGIFTWAAGAFLDSDDFGDRENGGMGSEWNVSGRVTAAPICTDDGRGVLHLGVAGSHRKPNDEMFELRSRPEVSTDDPYVDTGGMTAKNVTLFNFETACVVGPFSAQAEYARVGVDVVNGRRTDPVYHAWYVEASVFLTGEHRPYDRKKGEFGQPKPKRRLGKKGGIGAIQLGARYSELDLNEHFSRGGELKNWTFGVNWYLNASARLMVNWVVADRDTIAPHQFLTCRFQLSF